MPKVIVIIPGVEHHTTAALANAVADGAAHIRFMEIDVRATHDAAGHGQPKVFGRDEQLGDYDGIVFAVSSPPDDSDLNDFLDAAQRDAPRDAFLNSVFAVAGTDGAAILARVARLGGIIVTVPRTTDDPMEHARALGERVAKVVEWVRHARSHEHGHEHSHSHHHG